MKPGVALSRWDDAARDYDTVSRNSRAHQTKFERVADRVLLEQAGSVVDFGCGSGLLAATLAAHGYAGRFTGLDGSKKMLALAEKNNTSVQAEFLLHDLSQPTALPAASADVATAINVMFCLHDRYAFASEVFRVLKAGGPFLCVMPKPVSEGANAFLREHFRGLSAAGAAAEVVRLAGLLPAIIRTTRFQNELDGRHASGGDTYMAKEEVVAALERAGFVVESVEDIQARENWLFTARKPR